MVLVVLGMNVKKGGIDGMNGMSHHKQHDAAIPCPRCTPVAKLTILGG